MFKRAHIWIFSSLFLVLVLDTMGFGLIFPMLSPLFISTTGGLLPATTGLLTRQMLYGITLAIFSLGMFFGNPFLGDLSDRIGRKKVLMLCLFGSAFGLFLCAVAIQWHSVFWLIVGRGIGGFTAGSQAIAQAAIIDISDGDTSKANNLSLITLANCLGFVVGPIVGGYFSDPHIVAWFSYATPCWLAGALACINGLFIWGVLRETHETNPNTDLRLLKALYVFLDAFREKQLRVLSSVLGLLELGWVLYFLFVGWYLVSQFHYSNAQLGNFMAYLGVIWGLSLTLVMRYLTARFSLYFILVGSALIGGLGSILYIWPQTWMVWVAGGIVSAAAGIEYIALITLFSDAADEKNQGRAMGIAGAVVAAAWALGSLLLTFLGDIWLQLPFVVGGILMLCSLLFLLIKKESLPAPDPRT